MKSLSLVWLFITPVLRDRLLCLWDSPGKNTGVGYHFLLQGIFPGIEPRSPTLQADAFNLWATREAQVNKTSSKLERGLLLQMHQQRNNSSNTVRKPSHTVSQKENDQTWSQGRLWSKRQRIKNSHRATGMRKLRRQFSEPRNKRKEWTNTLPKRLKL